MSTAEVIRTSQVDLPLFDSRRFTHKGGVDVRNQGIGQELYLFGIDSVWHGATNALMFMCSLKMKLSVLFGVVRMIVGCCSGGAIPSSSEVA